jgi:predicted PurR-regulated permease PerM
MTSRHGNSALRAIVPAIGLSLVFLVLAGLGLAALHALNAITTALAVGIAALAATWYVARGIAEWKTRLRPLAIAGVLVFAVASVLAVHYSAASATTDADGASSLAVWAYPAGDRLQVGIQQPPGRGEASLRVVVNQDGITARAWNDIRLAPGQTWEAPALTLTGSGPVQVVVLNAGAVVASVSAAQD